MAHLALQSVENFTTLFLKLIDFILSIIGLAETSNPEYMGPNNTKHTPFIYSVQKETLYDQFVQLQRGFRLDVMEPITNVTRIAAGAFTNSLDKRREKVITMIRKSNTQAASAITRILPPHIQR